ncbi:hypothetical protein IKU74_01665 [bacterium]|nr:hypothetical protein [bacterium]
MNPKEPNIEEILLSETSLDELIRMKIEKELKTEIEKAKEAKNLKPTIIKTIKDVPKSKIFSKFAIYKIFNKTTKQETFINGIQAEALLGLQNNIREKLLNKEISAFSTDEIFVKFEKLCVNS